MERGLLRRRGIAAALSAIFPGLGQFYNRRIMKGIFFLLGVLCLLGVLLNQVDLETLELMHKTRVPPPNIGTIFGLSLLILGIALWSVIDAGKDSSHKQ